MKLACVFLACVVGIVHCGVEPRVVAYGAHITHPWWGQSSVWRTQIHPQGYALHESYGHVHDDHGHDFHPGIHEHEGPHFDGDIEEAGYDDHHHDEHHDY